MTHEVTTTQAHDVQRTDGQPLPTRESSRFQVPSVDIYETDDGLTVLVEMPGVDKDGVRVEVNNGILTIEGRTEQARPKTGEYYTEFELMPYYRRFELGEAIDQENIGASLKNGLLSISLPKPKKARPRRIEISAQ